MKLKLNIISKNETGSESSSQREFDQAEILIGRDAAADLQINRREISLHHAKLSFENSHLYVLALSPSASLSVNKIPSTRSLLKKGDHFQIGQETFEVLSLTPEIIIQYKVSEKENTSTKSSIEKLYTRWDTNRILKLATPISALLILFAVVFFFIRPLQSPHATEIWSSGPLHPVHRALTENCLVCHEGKFKKVTSARCLQCHELSPHPETIPSAQDVGDCMNCHSEHQGTQGLIMKSDSGCLNCHNSQSKLTEQKNKASEMQTRRSAFDHPDFELMYKEDPGRLKFSHLAHFQGKLPTEKGEADLVCSNCHRLKDDGIHFEAIEFERDCKKCHSLAFDSKNPNLELPHARADKVYAYLVEHFKKLAASKEENSEVKLSQRSLPGKQVNHLSQISSALDAERLIFEKTTCIYCHEVKNLEKRASDLQSQYQILHTNLPDSWSNRDLFTHQSHQGVACVQCHRQAEHSRSNAEILIPKFQDCLSCHNPTNFAGQERSYCTSCHSFHHRLPLKADKRENLERNLKNLAR